MLNKLSLYYHTIKYLKLSQIYYRLKKKAGLYCTLGYVPSGLSNDYLAINAPKELDFDTIFLKRFDADEFLNDRITFLNSTATFNWNGMWHIEDKSPLWNFNLHYFEFVFALLYKYQNTNEKKYFDKIIYIIEKWIDNNPVGIGEGWASYTIAVRITNWLSFYSYAHKQFSEVFINKFVSSLYEQYVYLSKHLEKDLLGNHYYEDLKALILASLFFNDNEMLKVSLEEFKKECNEQILPDGMHFELSPMYHKIILEDLLRVVIALNANGIRDNVLETYIKPMLDVAYTFENGLDRIPHFNDGGNNVAKSLNALINTAYTYFSMRPEAKNALPESGYYFFEQGYWKLIVDAGKPGPEYIPGHAHCDAMSFELFKKGKPVIVNCGTYAYQCKERSFFRSTRAHNTVMVDGIQQSMLWGDFRVAARSKVVVNSVDSLSIKISLYDYKCNMIERDISINGECIRIKDSSNQKIVSSIHVLDKSLMIDMNERMKQGVDLYSEEYGLLGSVNVITNVPCNNLTTHIFLKE